ncbi:MAG TPA: Usg family protein [Alphaproteobacteria bacterium]|nr:Usg family protein [Alphaproteobacteria bacterium]HAJ46334.1 Usg family protein [Alphaproteobacteria bacterium]
MSALDLQMKGYRLTTAEIMYHMPDHPKLLQQFVWQDLDLAPRYPVLHKFLKFWSRNLDGRLHSVRVAVCGIITPVEIPHIDAELTLH